MMAINKDNFEDKREVPVIPATEGRSDQSAHLSSLTKGRSPPMKKGRSQRRQNTVPAAEQLLDKYLRPSEAPRPCRKSRVACKRDTHSVRWPAFPAEVYSKAPDKRFSVMHLPGESVTAFDGKQGWLSVPGRVHMMSAAENAAARIDADLYLPAHLKTLYQEFRVNAGTRLMVMKRTWLWGKRRPAAAAFIPGQGVGPAAAPNPVRRNASRPQPNSDRLCGLSRCGWSEDAVSLDAGASREPIHHTDRAGSAKCSRGRRQVRAGTRFSAW